MNVVSVVPRRGPKRTKTPEEIRAKRIAHSKEYYLRKKNDPEFKARRAEWARNNKQARKKFKRKPHWKRSPKKPLTTEQKAKEALRKRRKRQENLEYARSYGRIARSIRRARESKAEGFFTKADIKTLMRTQKGKCVYFHACGNKLSSGFHVDHITALSKGGTNWPKNIQLLCVSCNCGKWSKDPLEFSRQQGLLL